MSSTIERSLALIAAAWRRSADELGRHGCRRMRGLFERKRLERELDERFDFTWRCKLRTTSSCMNPAEARYAALRSFGGLERMKETYRERGRSR